MRMTLLLVFILGSGCAVNPVVGVSTSAVKIDPAKDDLEPTWVNDVQCKIVFQGALTPSTQMYAIWAVGTHGLVNTPYNIPSRPKLYAIFGTGRPASETHHVAGYNQFDHYHIAQNPADDNEVENRVWDVLSLWPGPNFNATTYVSAKNVADMNAQSAAGVLSPVIPLTDIGFPPFVLNAPIVCPEEN